MAEYSSENRGSIWKNEKKSQDTRPDFTGSLNVNGIDYWVSAWKRKEGASSKAPALSFSVKPKDDQPQQAVSQRDMPKRPDPVSSGKRSFPGDYDMNDDVPF